MASIELLQSETQAINAEVSLVNAKNTWRQRELTLKRLLVTGTEDPLYAATINPIEQVTASLSEPALDVKAAITAALGQRTDLTIQRKNLQVQEMGLAVTKNQLLPAVTLNTSYSASGSGGPQVSNGVITVPGGYFDAVKSLVSFDKPQWSLQFGVTYPLGQVQQKVNLANAQLSYEQAKQTLKGVELTVATDITNAAITVQSSWQSYSVSQRARVVAEKNLEAEQTRFDLGLSNNYNVATAQNNVTTQRLGELNALVAYINALADFERKQKFGGS